MDPELGRSVQPAENTDEENDDAVFDLQDEVVAQTRPILRSVSSSQPLPISLLSEGEENCGQQSPRSLTPLEIEFPPTGSSNSSISLRENANDGDEEGENTRRSVSNRRNLLEPPRKSSLKRLKSNGAASRDRTQPLSDNSSLRDAQWQSLPATPMMTDAPTTIPQNGSKSTQETNKQQFPEDAEPHSR